MGELKKIYEYLWRKCGNEVEALQARSDAPLTDCPECGAAALRESVSAAGVRLKGGGWYETDFKTGNKKNLHGASDSSSSSDKPSTSGGSESKKTA